MPDDDQKPPITPLELPSSRRETQTSTIAPLPLPSEAAKAPQQREPAPESGGETYTMPTETGELQTFTQPKKAAYEEYPTLADLPVDKLPGPSRAPLTFGPAMAETVEGRKNILKKHLPGATFENDKYGNPLVVHEGKKYHIARPDAFNAQDVGSAIFQAAPTVALSGLATIPGGGWLLGLAELASAGYISNQARAWLGRKAGSEEPTDLTSTGSLVEGTLNAILPGAGKLLREIGPGISRGAQRVLPIKKAAEEALERVHPDDLGFHTDPANAATLVRDHPYTAISKEVEAAAAKHAENAPVRIGRDLDQTFGAADTNIKDVIGAVKGQAGSELKAVLDQSGALDIKPLVASIDEAIAKAAPNTPTAKALQRLKSMLTEQEGAAGTSSTRTAVEGTVPGRPIYRTTPGQPGTEPVYVSDATKLHEIKRTFDQLLKWGDQSAGIAPRSISPTDYAIGTVRKNLSGVLNDNVRGYQPLMERYQTAYDMADAYAMGQKIMTGGKNALDLDQVKPFLQSNPHEAEAFRIGVRDAMDAVIRTAADGKDAAAVKKILSGENSYRREILNEMYGKEAIDNLVKTAEREGNYAVINQHMIRAAQAGRDLSGVARAARAQEPVVGNVRPDITIPGLVGSGVSKGLNWIGSRLGGTHGPRFERELANLMTGPGKPMLESILDAYKPGLSMAPATSTVPPVIAESHRPVGRESHAGGGRVDDTLRRAIEAYEGAALPAGTARRGHAEGGKVSADHIRAAQHMVNLVQRARKTEQDATKPLLRSNDSMVASALAAASRSI